MTSTPQLPKLNGLSFKEKLKALYRHILSLQGDSQYVATGMAVGIFVSFTPLIPFHTVIAVSLAFLIKGSKPAAAIGVWLSNPLTFPFFYYANYKVGILLVGRKVPFDMQFDSISHLLKLGMDATLTMVLGGIVLSIVPTIASYYLTFYMHRKIQARRRMKAAYGKRKKLGRRRLSSARQMKAANPGRSKIQKDHDNTPNPS